MNNKNQDHRLRLYLNQEARAYLERLKANSEMSASQVITAILLKMSDLGMEKVNELQQASK